MEATAKKAKKSKRFRLIAAIVLLAVLLAGGGAYGYLLYTAPKRALNDFLKNVQKLDLDNMASKVSGGDLSLLDSQDITDPAFSDFYRQAASLMTYDIKSMRSHGSSATVTAEIKYPDGTDVYKNTISDFMKQVLSSAYSDTAMSEEEMKSQLAQYLTQHSQDLGQSYSNLSVDFSMIKENGAWYVQTLNPELLQVITANFNTVEQTLGSMTGDGTTAAPVAPDDGSTISLSTEEFTLTYSNHTLVNDYAGNPCIQVYYDYTNLTDAPATVGATVSLQAYQNGQPLTGTIPDTDDPAIDQYMNEVPAGATVNVCQVFSLLGSSDVTLSASEAFSFDSQASLQLVKLQ